MRLKIETLEARKVEGGLDIYYVLGNEEITGKLWCHNGPYPIADFFTKDQAERLVSRIKAAEGIIAPEHWYCDTGGYYNQEYADQMYEWEEIEKLAGRW